MNACRRCGEPVLDDESDYSVAPLCMRCSTQRGVTLFVCVVLAFAAFVAVMVAIGAVR